MGIPTSVSVNNFQKDTKLHLSTTPRAQVHHATEKRGGSHVKPRCLGPPEANFLAFPVTERRPIIIKKSYKILHT